MATTTIKTRVLIISDTHCAPLTEKEAQEYGRSKPIPPFQHPLPKADLLIHCGDLTHTGKLAEYHATLDLLKNIDAPVKLVIAGNHDLTLDRDYLLTHRDEDGVSEESAERTWLEMRDLWTSPDGRAKQEGVTFLDEGNHSIDLPNGARATVYASPYTPEFCDWGFPYERKEDRFNSPGTTMSDAKNIAPFPVPSFTEAQTPIDILMTHGPPYRLLDETRRGDFAGCPHLLRALMRCRPLIHCFGHIHEGWGAERIKWSAAADRLTTTSVNTASWTGGNWKTGVEGGGGKDVDVDIDDVREHHGSYIDVSQGGGDGIDRGTESLLVNAAIMNVAYKPVNGPWVVDVDLPRGV